jgi:hypothetical protein
MTVFGWLLLITSWTFIIFMLIYCFYRVFSAEKLD